MGPSRFCVESICRIGNELSYHFNTRSWSWQPSNYEDVIYLIQQLRAHKPLIEQYISNMNYGIAAGMVRSVEQCEVGYYSLINKFHKVSTLGEKGWYFHTNYTMNSGIEGQKYVKNARLVPSALNYPRTFIPLVLIPLTKTSPRRSLSELNSSSKIRAKLFSLIHRQLLTNLVF